MMIYKSFFTPDSDYKYTIFYCKNKFISLKINRKPPDKYREVKNAKFSL